MKNVIKTRGRFVKKELRGPKKYELNEQTKVGEEEEKGGSNQGPLSRSEFWIW